MDKELTEYEKMTWETPSDELEDAKDNLITEVKRLRRELKYYSDNCTVVWQPEDVLSIDNTLTDKQVSWVLGMMERKHDASLGISWTTIEFWASEAKKEGD
jgi:hypothetical protein